MAEMSGAPPADTTELQLTGKARGVDLQCMTRTSNKGNACVLPAVGSGRADGQESGVSRNVWAVHEGQRAARSDKTAELDMHKATLTTFDKRL